MYVRRQVLTIPDGNPVPDDTQVEMRLHADDSIVGTTGTQNGWFEFQTIGNPGPHYFRVTYDDETQVSSSQSTGVSGVVDVGNLPLFIRAFRSGYIDNVLNELNVSAGGTTLSVNVAAGAGYYRGVLYDQHASVPLTIAAPSAQPRIDRVVVEVIPQGAGVNVEGRSLVKVKQGIPAATPTVPSLTQTNSLWEEPLAQVRVDPGVTAIASNKVTDERAVFSPIIGSKTILKSMLADNATPGVRVQQGGTLITAHARMLNFDVRDFIATRSAVENDYTSDAYPYVTLMVDRAKLLAYIEDNIDIPEQQQPVPNPTYTVRSADSNFNASGSWSGGWATISGGSVSISLPAGAWLIETILNMTIRGTGSGAQCTIRLSGDATPQGAQQSMRIFAVASQTYREVVLSGRRTVSHSGTKTYTARVDRTHQSGAYVDFRDGVIYVKAYRV